MHRQMTKDLQDKIINDIANLKNSSLISFKQLAKKYDIDTAQIVTISQRNKTKINSIKMELNNVAVQEQVKEDNSEKDIKSQNTIYLYNYQPVPETIETTETEKSESKDDHRILIAENIEKESSCYQFSNGKFVREIHSGDLRKIAEKFGISYGTAMKIAEEYDIKIEKEKIMTTKTPKSLRKNQIPDEVWESVEDDLKNTSLKEMEIAELNGISSFSVNTRKRTKNIIRPNKEDETVKEKTKKRKEEIRRRKQLKEAANKATETVTVNQSKPAESTETNNNQIQEKKPEISAGTTAAAVKEFEKAIEKPFTEINIKPMIIEKLNNKNIIRILIEDSIDCDLVYSRHPTPNHIGIFNNELDDIEKHDYDIQYESCEKFLKNNIRFINGVPEKSVNLYVSGIQSAYTNFIKACYKLKVNLITYHYDTVINGYKPLPLYTEFPVHTSYGVGMKTIMKYFNDTNYRYNCTVKQIEENTSNLFIIKCTENCNDSKRKSCQIICRTEADYKSIYMSVINVLVRENIHNFELEAIEFNFSTTGEIVKNYQINRFSC